MYGYPPTCHPFLSKSCSKKQDIEYDNNDMKYELYHDTELFTLKTWNIFAISGKTKFTFVDMFILSKTSYLKDHVTSRMIMWLLNNIETNDYIYSWIFCAISIFDISDAILVWWKNLLEISVHQKV